MVKPFIVLVTKPGDDNEVIQRINNQPDQYQLADNLWLVRSSLLVKDLCNELGMGEESVGSGIVFRLNGAYWGRADPNTWDWLDRAE